ncbi:hypothetical protein [Hansschlegelia zhihuaiae]|uniref:Uncharacterized protein n=1 Tax=Hansschlegelia zhihuaiae TaxID=405005 RepID=A0A4Q0M520_9HYPH|nr:hypothetical protein [Hansschlegelia zhihuaiae]RXF68088.1 hypothetical protein EK403_20500 [Hansschlegelia zhihuaiae]
MTITTLKRSIDELGSRLFARDHPHRSWRAYGSGYAGGQASPEERALYRSFAAAMLRERESSRGLRS